MLTEPGPYEHLPGALRDLAPGTIGMVLVGSSVTVSRSLVHAPLFATQAVRYAAATLLLLAFARAARVPILRPRGRSGCGWPGSRPPDSCCSTWPSYAASHTPNRP